jgi:hypothetical protein
MKEIYYPPAYLEVEFHCPYCGVYSHQKWTDIIYQIPHVNIFENAKICICFHCEQKSIWINQNMIYPMFGSAPRPNIDLPEDIIDDFNEARNILNKSPRGAAALLRLAVQKLCKHLGGKGINLNEDIAKLVENGLSTKVQKSLDYVRVIGNNSVHPGQIDLKDNIEIASQLFSLINIIADVMISQPKEIDELYNSLPENQILAINKRDRKELNN